MALNKDHPWMHPTLDLFQLKETVLDDLHKWYLTNINTSFISSDDLYNKGTDFITYYTVWLNQYDSPINFAFGKKVNYYSRRIRFHLRIRRRNPLLK